MQQANLFLSNSLEWLRTNSIKSILLSLFTLLGLVTTAQCTYTLDLRDSYSDGWSGNNIDIKVGTNTTNYSLSAGLADTTFNLTVNTGDSIVLTYFAVGTWPGDVSFELFDPSGNSIYFSGAGPATGVAYADTAICASCLSPINLGASNILTTSADLSWTEQNAATSWHLEVTTAGSGLGSGVRAVVSSNPYSATGLTAGTSYDYYVKSICTPGTDSSGWAGPFSFTTNIPAITTYPYFEGFETAVPPAGWTTNIVQGLDDWTQAAANQNSSITPYAGSNMAFYFSGNYSGNSSRLITPNFDLTSLTQPQLEVWHTQVDWSGDQDTIGIYYRTSPSGTWTLLASASSSITSWSQVLTSLPNPSATYALMFEAYSGWGRGVTLDNFEIKETPNCAIPTALSAANITATTADLDWTENGTATQWQIEYGTNGFTQGTGDSVLVNAKPFTLGSLMAQTSYDYYVRSICAPGDTSAWSSSSSFTTPCAVFTPNYNEDFTSFLPNCWDEAGDGSIATGPTSIGSGLWTNQSGGASFGNSARINLYTTNRSEWLLSPAFDLTGGPFELVIDAAVTNWNSTTVADNMGSDDSVQVAISTDNGVTWTSIYVWDVVNQPTVTFTPYTIDLTPYNNQTVQFGILATDGPVDDSEDYDFHIGNFEVRTPPTCPDPSFLSASNITSNSADLGWTENGTATTWIIEYGPTGYTPGSGTRDTVTANPYTLSGLMSNTSYDWYVQSACGLNDSSAFQGPGSFTTPCNAIAAPFTESFATNALPSCWNESSVSPNDSWEFGTSVDFGSSSVRPDAFGNTGEYANVDFSDDPDTTAIITPIVDITGLTNPRLTFYYNSQTTSTSFSPFNRLIVDYWNGSSWVNVTVIDTLTTAGWTKYEFSAAGYAFNTNFVQFRFAAQEGGAAIGGTGTTTYDQDLMLDEVVVEDTPPCLTPSTLAAANLTTNSADLSWVENNAATSWEISYGPAGFTPGNGTEVVVTTNPYTLSGLMDNTTYDWSVRSICGNNDTSAWAAQGSFTTAFAPCPSLSSAATLPFVERWESASGTLLNIGNIVCASDYTWTFNSNDPVGRVRYGTDAVLASAGSGAVTLDRQSSGAVAANELILTIQMSAYNTATDLELLFDYSNHGEESHAGDSVWVRGSDTDPWVGIYDLYANRPATGAYLAVGPLDVDAALTAAGQAPSASFQVKFGQEDNFPATSPTVSDGFSFDNITLRETPSCYAPINQTTSVITTTSADFSWTDTMTTTAPEYEYSYGAPGFTPGTGTELVVTTDSVTVSGLTPSTNYDWYVRAICGNNDTSLWSSTVSFTTLCTPFAAPFTESFDNTTQPTCWSQSAIQGGPWTFAGPGFTWNTQGCTFVPTDHTGNSGSFAALDFSVPDAGVVLEMPDVNVSALTAPYLEFYYVQCNNLTPNNELFIEAFNGATWDSVTVIQRGTNGWERFGFQVGAFTYSTNLVKLRFRAEDGGGIQFYGDMGLDDISIIETPGTELEASLIVAPNSGCSLTASETVSLSITNNGSAAQTGFSVGYSLNGTAITPETYTATIAPGATATYNFTTTADLSVAGVYNLVAYVDLPGDIDNSNDTASTTVLSSSVVSAFPYAESFESGAAGWLVEGNAAWELGAPIGAIIDTASDGTQAWVTDLDSNYSNSATGFVNSPCLDFTSVPNPYIEMDIWWDIETSWDGAVLQASTDNGVTWQKVGDFGDPNNWYNDNTIGALNAIEPSEEGWTGTGASGSGAWVTAGHELDGLGGIANVKLRVAFASDGSVNDEGMAFDNVHIFDSVPPLPYYPIGTINTEDATTGVADSINVECATSGTVIGFDRRGGGYEFAIVDMSSGSQEGITVFDFSDVSGYTTPTVGDSIMVYGNVDQFRGLTQFRPDSITVISTNASLPTPTVSNIVDETTESILISMTDKFVFLDASGSGSFNADAVSVTNPSDTITIRVDSDSDIDDSLAISTNTWVVGDTLCGLVGVGGQFDFNSPFLDSYQVFPNSWADLTICRNTVGIDESKVEEFGSLSIYPNPTNGQFTIQTSGLKASNALLQVRDVSGRVVLEDNIAQSNQAFSRNYNLNDPAKGLYFITLIDGNEQKTFKLIVQ